METKQLPVELFSINMLDPSGAVEKIRWVAYDFGNQKIKFKVNKDRKILVSEPISKSAKNTANNYKRILCPYHIDTREFDYEMLDEWVIENSTGLWFREGYSLYGFQIDNDAAFFKLTWGF